MVEPAGVTGRRQAGGEPQRRHAVGDRGLHHRRDDVAERARHVRDATRTGQGSGRQFGDLVEHEIGAELVEEGEQTRRASRAPTATRT